MNIQEKLQNLEVITDLDIEHHFHNQLKFILFTIRNMGNSTNQPKSIV